MKFMPVDHLQESRELRVRPPTAKAPTTRPSTARPPTERPSTARPPIVRFSTVKASSARPSSTGPTQVQGGVFNMPFIRSGMANQASNPLVPEPRHFLHGGKKVTTRQELQKTRNVRKNQQ
ncbi:hypothetical protein POM88_053151 [Heracleum sosnowskyi]|uniref:Uncharacterized protein n=1 Tax=Heracleum sosnowskyi TaxID=360622 RepID=A0AAD8GR81_9APIA|nr:hypothetical protein POM88_053151 [Heracleum sosnowskyi]